jgi:1-aminocyclopropane-1-carboxylate deaminase/D-cysteine desulfhydrase-like pyridoxal-dependent ACC family enzyme
MTTIFDTPSIDRNIVKWENHLQDLTPIEQYGEIWFKREDKFAPMGFGSVNGSKLRQCIWLVNRWYKQGIKGIISGSVVGSPQHPFISSICKHYGLGCLIVTGSKNYLEHKNMRLAQQLGAKFYVANITYARALQSICFKLKDKLPNHEVLETNITLDDRLNSPESIEGFHKIGSYQTQNIPEHIETIIIPCGSCNSVTSILYGLALNKPKKLKHIILIGIGNNGSFNLQYIPKRLAIISKVIGIDLNKEFNYPFSKNTNQGIEVLHFNPNGEGFCTYQDLMPFDYFGLVLHPRYEGKCFNYMAANKEKFAKYWNKNTLFWVVGNEPTYV